MKESDAFISDAIISEATACRRALEYLQRKVMPSLETLLSQKHVPANVLFRQYTVIPERLCCLGPLEASESPLKLRFGASKQLYRPIPGKKKIALPLRVSSKKRDAFVSDAIFILEISA